MGKFHHVVFFFSASLLLNSNVYASDSRFYLSGDFVAGFADMDNIQNSGPITGNIRSNQVEDDDLSGGFSAGIGYEWRQFRIEAEYLWRYRFDFGAQFTGNGGESIGSNIGTESIRLKSMWMFKNTTKLTPFIGVGIGWAEHEAETNRGNQTTFVTSSAKTTTDNFIWSFIVGANYPFFDNWEVEMNYRYSDLGDVEIGPFTDGGFVETEYTSHDLSIGINYLF